MSLQTFWNRITNIGVNETELGREIVKVRILNQLMFVALLTSTFVLIAYIITKDTTTLVLTTLVNMIIESLGLFLAYKKQHHLTRYAAFWLLPTWIGVNVVLNNGGFGEANIFSTAAFCAFIMYEGERKLQIPSVVYITVVFIISKLYVINYGDLATMSFNPYDEIITFPFILIILGLIILLYQREIKKFEAQREKWISELEEKNKALSEVNEELEQFTYIASHDLKTPLRTISSHLDLIKWHIDKKDFEAVNEDIVFAKRGAKQMYTLINDILEYKQLNNTNDSFSIVDLNDIFLTIVDQLKVYIEEKNAEVHFASLPKVKARTTDIMILFQNLIDNGIKYNKSTKPLITISHEIGEENLILKFEDNGIGIEEEYQDKIFQFFKRLHGSNEYEGTGIGLGLCKKIVQNYNGSIAVQTSKNGGSIFVIQLPLSMIVKE